MVLKTQNFLSTQSEFSLTILKHVNIQFPSVVLSLKEEIGHDASTQGGEEKLFSLCSRGGGMGGRNGHKPRNQKKKRGMMGMGKQAGEDREEEKSFCLEIRGLLQC